MATVASLRAQNQQLTKELELERKKIIQMNRERTKEMHELKERLAVEKRHELEALRARLKAEHEQALAGAGATTSPRAGASPRDRGQLARVRELETQNAQLAQKVALLTKTAAAAEPPAMAELRQALAEAEGRAQQLKTQNSYLKQQLEQAKQAARPGGNAALQRQLADKDVELDNLRKTLQQKEAQMLALRRVQAASPGPAAAESGRGPGVPAELQTARDRLKALEQLNDARATELLVLEKRFAALFARSQRIDALQEENRALREECQRRLQPGAAPDDLLAAPAAPAEAWQSAHMDARNRELFDRAHEQQSQLAQAADKIKALEAQLASQAARQPPPPEQLAEAQRQLTELEAQVHKLTVANARLKARADALEELDKEAAGLEAQLVTAQGKLRRLQKTIELQQAELDGGASGDQLLHRQNAALRAQVHDLEAHDAELAAQVAALKRQLHDLERSTASFDAQQEAQTSGVDMRTARLQERLDISQADQPVAHQVQQLHAQLDAVEAELLAAQQAVRAAQADQAAVKQQLLEATERAARAEAAAATQQRHLEVLQARAARTASAGTAPDDELAQTRSERDAAETQAREAQVAHGGAAARADLLEKQNADLPRLQAQLQAAKARLQLYEHDARRHPGAGGDDAELDAATTSALQQAALDANRRADRLAAQVAALEAELDKLNSKHIEATRSAAEALGQRAAEVESLTDTNHRLQTRLLAAQEDLPPSQQQAEAQRDDLERRLAAAEAQLRQSNTDQNRDVEARRRQSVQVGLKEAELQTLRDQAARLQQQADAAGDPAEQERVLRQQLDELTQRVAQLQAQNAELKADNGVLEQREAALSGVHNELLAAQTRLARLQQQLDQLQPGQAADRQPGPLALLGPSDATARDLRRELARERARHAVELEAAHDQLQQLKQQNARLAPQATAGNVEATQAELELMKMGDKINGQEHDVADFNNQLEHAEHLARNERAARLAMQAQLDAEQAKVRRLEGRLEALQRTRDAGEELQQARAECSALDGELHALKVQAGGLTTRNEQLQDELAELAGLRNRLRAAESKVRRLEDALAAARGADDAAAGRRGTLAQVSPPHHQRRSTFTTNELQEEVLRTTSPQRRRDHVAAGDDVGVAALRKRVLALEREKDALETQEERLHQEMMDLEQELRDARREHAQEQGQWQGEAQSQRDQLDRLRAQVAASAQPASAQVALANQQRDTLDAQLQATQAERLAAQREAAQLRRASELSERELVRARAGHDAAREQLALARASETPDAHRDALEAQVQTLKQQNAELQHELSAMSRRPAAGEGTDDGVDEGRVALLRDNARLRGEVASLQDQVARLEQRLEEALLERPASEQLVATEVDRDNLEHQLRARERELAAAQAALEEAKARHAATREQLGVEQGHSRGLQEQLQRLQADLADKNKFMTARETQAAADRVRQDLEARNLALHKENGRLQALLDMQGTPEAGAGVQTEANVQAAQGSSSADALQRDNALLAESNDALRQNNAEQQAQLETLQRDKGELEREVARLRRGAAGDDNQALRAQLDAAQREAQTLQAQLDRLKREAKPESAAASKDRSTMLQSEVDDLHLENRDLTDEVARLQKENDELRAELARLKAELARLLGLIPAQVTVETLQQFPDGYLADVKK